MFRRDRRTVRHAPPAWPEESPRHGRDRSVCRVDRRAISAGMVAENSSDWRFAGRAAMILRTSRTKPMSSIRSASSRTNTWIPPRSSRPCFMRSSRRPGVAVTMSTPRQRASTWGFWPTPPKITVWRSRRIPGVGAEFFADLDREFASGCKDQRARSAPNGVFAIAGKPVENGQREGRRLACPGLGDAHQIAASLRRSGIARAWIGVGSTWFLAVSARCIGSARPRSENLVFVKKISLCTARPALVTRSGRGDPFRARQERKHGSEGVRDKAPWHSARRAIVRQYVRSDGYSSPRHHEHVRIIAHRGNGATDALECAITH